MSPCRKVQAPCVCRSGEKQNYDTTIEGTTECTRFVNLRFPPLACCYADTDPDTEPPHEKAWTHGHNRSYNSGQFKRHVVAELVQDSIAMVDEKYKILWSTISSWEDQFKMGKKQCPDTSRGY